MRKQQLVFVAGHQRPDTDATVAATVLARLRRKLDRKRKYQPILLGQPTRQTKWLFKQAGVPLPPVRGDIRWTVEETLGEAAWSLPPSARLGDAMAILQTHRISMVPVTAADGTLMGVVSPRLPHNEYFFNFNVEDYLGHLLALDDVVATFSLQLLTDSNAGEATMMPGSFRVANGGTYEVEPGDVVMAGASAKVVRDAERRGAQAVILADATLVEAKKAAVGSRRMLVYYYPGSLLALLSSLSLAIPVRTIMDTDPVTLRPDQRLDQVLPALQNARHALPVVDAKKRLVGVLSQSDSLAPSKRPLILVDHFERTQTVQGIESAIIEEIVDHHRVGGIETLMPARVDCRPLGSSATIIALKFEEARLVPSPKEAMLLLGAMISDTLLLTSPTTTDIDRRLAPQLAKRAKVDLATFGREVLRENDELAEAKADYLVSKDVKAFARGELNFGAAQIETIDLTLLTAERSAELRSALARLQAQSGWGMAALIVTDVIKGCSRLLVSDLNEARASWVLEGAELTEGRNHAGMVSRKKQLLPFLFDRLDQFQS